MNALIQLCPCRAGSHNDTWHICLSIPDVAEYRCSHKQCLINAWNHIKTLLLGPLFKEELFVKADHSVLARGRSYTRILQETIASNRETSRVHKYNTL